MDDFLSEATAKGLHVVDNNKLSESYADYDQILRETERLCEIEDPEETPYKSKYEARDLLDSLCNRMEANRTIASLEKNGDMVKELNWRIAAVRVRIASIAWEVEEPHNTQVELELAAEFYAPGVVSTINEMSGEVESEASKQVDDSIRPPEVEVKDASLCADTMKCFNLMGILWAGRDHLKRSFLYLLAAKEYYDRCSGVDISTAVRVELESTLTHNLFYLAQAYGNIGNATLSSLYCHMTLQRQLNAGLKDTKSAIEWCKNCMGMADFHIALLSFHRAAHALGATEVILSRELGDAESTGTIEEKGEDQPSLTQDDRDKIGEIKMDLNRRWITLDTAVLKRAYEEQFYENEEDQKPTVFGFDKNAPELDGCIFQSLDVPVVPLLGKGEVKTFDDARAVYLRCAARLETAKKNFPIDGFVTDHVTLLRQHSQLYHYLAGFESDIKRKLAMEIRRADLLKALPNSLSRNAFEGLVKGVSYELGEIYMNALELKTQKILSKTSIESMKAVDREKCNEYIACSIAMFLNFISFYIKSGDGPPRSGEIFSSMQLTELMQFPFLQPSYDLVAEEEVRPLLNSHFFICRLLSKVIPNPKSTPAEKTKPMVAALKRYQWLKDAAPEICEKKGTSVSDIFHDEIRICEEMTALLPPKIDRMHYLGEGGL